MSVFKPTIGLTAWLAVCVVSIQLSQRPAAAQAAAEPAWQTIRTRDPVSQLDRTSIEQWATAEIGAILAEKAPQAALERGKAFFKSAYGNASAVNATPAFRSTLAEVIAQQFDRQYDIAADPADMGAAIGRIYLLVTMKELKEPGCKDALVKSLPDPSPGARAIAAQGLLLIRPAPPELQVWLRPVLPVIQRVGVDETNNAVLARLYRLLETNNGAVAADTLPVAQNILQARFARMATGKSDPLPADAEATAWLAERFSFEQQQGKTDIVKSIGTLLAHAVHMQVNRTLDERTKEQNLTLITAAETQLKDTTQPPAPAPNVLGLLKRGEKPAPDAVAAELAKWIGGNGASGILNAAPFELPPGLGIQRAVAEPEK